MNILKRAVKAFLRTLGLELHRVCESECKGDTAPRATMVGGLKWLSDNGFNVKTIIDVGVSNGCWSKECMNYYPGAKYVLFEPQPVHSCALDEFAAAQKQSVKVIKKAVGASEGVTYFNVSDPFGGALAAEKNDYTVEVALTTIDASLADERPEYPCLLKLDTHGFEKGILEGSTKTLENADVLIIEAYNYRITDDALLFWELCAFLDERDFRPIDLVDILHRKKDNSLWQMDLIFVRSDWEGFDYVSYQ